MFVVDQVGAHQGRAHDGQALACLQLVGQRKQPGLLHILLGIHAHQHQQLRPGGGQSHSTWGGGREKNPGREREAAEGGASKKVQVGKERDVLTLVGL